MNTPERVLLLSLHPRFATAILTGEKTVELRRQRVAVPPGTPVIIYATSPVMALTGTAHLAGVDTAAPEQIWRRHRTACGISKAEYITYMEGAAHASALLLDRPRTLSSPVPLDHLRATSAFHPPQSYRYLSRQELQQLVNGHEAADELLSRFPWHCPPARTAHAAAPPPPAVAPSRPRPDPLRSAVLTASAPTR
ncbi:MULTISPECIES: hypothetical protein [Streptomyces]|uniref:hypothetical protein n=1 Tax=Streptomyces TaxID=1883 RepID=UPI0033BDAA63